MVNNHRHSYGESIKKPSRALLLNSIQTTNYALNVRFRSIGPQTPGAVLMYLLCVFLVYRRWIAPLPVVGQLRNVGVPWLVGAMAAVYVGEFLLGKALALPAEPFITKLFADKSIPDVILTLLTIFILAPLNEETLFRGIMLNVFRSRYGWTMWLGALITSLLFVAAHSQYQKWWPAAAGIAAYGSNHAGFTVWLKVIFLLNIVR